MCWWRGTPALSWPPFSIILPSAAIGMWRACRSYPRPPPPSRRSRQAWPGRFSWRRAEASLSPYLAIEGGWEAFWKRHQPALQEDVPEYPEPARAGRAGARRRAYAGGPRGSAVRRAGGADPAELEGRSRRRHRDHAQHARVLRRAHPPRVGPGLAVPLDAASRRSARGHGVSAPRREAASTPCGPTSTSPIAKSHRGAR